MNILTEEFYREMQKIDDEKQINTTYHKNSAGIIENTINRELNIISLRMVNQVTMAL